jgi:hypothetical protein
MIEGAANLDGDDGRREEDYEFDLNLLNSKINGMKQTPAEQFRRDWQPKVDDAIERWEKSGDRIHLEEICIELYRENTNHTNQLVGVDDRLAREFLNLSNRANPGNRNDPPYERPSDEWAKDQIERLSPDSLKILAQSMLDEGLLRREVVQGLRPIGQNLHSKLNPTLPPHHQFVSHDETSGLNDLDTERLLALAHMPDKDREVAEAELYEAMVDRASEVLIDLYNHQKSRDFLVLGNVDLSKEKIKQELREEIDALVGDKDDFGAKVYQAARLLESVVINYRQMTD